MSLRDDYPYDEAITDLEKIFDKTISDPCFRQEMQITLDKCRQAQSIPIRSIFERFIVYRKKTGDLTDLPQKDKELIDDLFHFWG